MPLPLVPAQCCVGTRHLLVSQALGLDERVGGGGRTQQRAHTCTYTRGRTHAAAWRGLRWTLTFFGADSVEIAGAEAAGESTMKPSSALLVSHHLVLHRHSPLWLLVVLWYLDWRAIHNQSVLVIIIKASEPASSTPNTPHRPQRSHSQEREKANQCSCQKGKVEKEKW